MCCMGEIFQLPVGNENYYVLYIIGCGVEFPVSEYLYLYEYSRYSSSYFIINQVNLQNLKVEHQQHLVYPILY